MYRHDPDGHFPYDAQVPEALPRTYLIAEMVWRGPLSEPVGPAMRHPVAPCTLPSVQNICLELQLHADGPHNTPDECISL